MDKLLHWGLPSGYFNCRAFFFLWSFNLFFFNCYVCDFSYQIMVCHCKPPPDGKKGCGDGCLNRMLNIECVKGTCPCRELCSNQQVGCFYRFVFDLLTFFMCVHEGNHFLCDTLVAVSEAQVCQIELVPMWKEGLWSPVTRRYLRRAISY